MSVKFLLVFLGIFLAGAVTLYSQVKGFAGSFTGKRPAVYGLLSGTLAGALTFGAALVSDQLFTLYWLLSFLFLAFGIVHVLLTRERYFAPREGNSRIAVGEYFFAASVLLFTVSVGTAMLYFLKDRMFLFFPTLVSAATFFVPLLFLHLFRAAVTIPSPEYTLWQYPDRPIPTPDIKPNEQLLVIGYEVPKREEDTNFTYFRAKAIEDLTLGEMFYHFLYDYNEEQSETPVLVRNAQAQPYKWWFRIRPRWYQFNRVLNPDLNFRQNKIRENTVIICERYQD